MSPTQAERDYKRAYDERTRERQREQKRAWAARNREAQMERTRRERLEQPERSRARNLVQKAVDRGHMEKPATCSACDDEGVRIEAHHEDYERPLDVTWLCKPCHYKADRAREEVAA